MILPLKIRASPPTSDAATRARLPPAAAVLLALRCLTERSRTLWSSASHATWRSGTGSRHRAGTPRRAETPPSPGPAPGVTPPRRPGRVSGAAGGESRPGRPEAVGGRSPALRPHGCVTLADPPSAGPPLPLRTPNSRSHTGGQGAQVHRKGQWPVRSVLRGLSRGTTGRRREPLRGSHAPRTTGRKSGVPGVRGLRDGPSSTIGSYQVTGHLASPASLSPRHSRSKNRCDLNTPLDSTEFRGRGLDTPEDGGGPRAHRRQRSPAGAGPAQRPDRSSALSAPRFWASLFLALGLGFMISFVWGF